MKRFLIVAIATVIASALSPVVVHAAPVLHRAAEPNGINTTCTNTANETDYCEHDDGACQLRAWVPDINHADPLNDRLKVSSRLTCNDGKDRLRLGASVLGRYDCEWMGYTFRWRCSNETTLGMDDFHIHYCGYETTHSDAPSCQYVATGYNYVAMTWYYDQRDGSGQCHGFTQEVNGTYTTSNNVTHSIHEQDTAARLYGPDSHGISCSGVVT